MSKQKTIPEMKAEIADNERQLAQLRHKQQQLENRAAYYEKGDRQKRAHHLITRGAAVESVAPLAKVLSETEFYAFPGWCTAPTAARSCITGQPTEGAFFDCSLHWKHKDKCGTHYIREVVLSHIVLKHIQAVTGYILRHEAHFRTVMEEQLRLESGEQIRIRRKRLERNENRIAELKRLFIRIYEDNASGRLSDDRYDMLSLTYETEQKQLEAECVTLRQEIEVQERQNENIEKFIQTAYKYVGIDELDGYALRKLVSAIYVDAPDKSSGKRVQHIHIKYDVLGFIPLNELMKEETA